MYATARSFLLFHEYAHVVLGHSNRAAINVDEYAADSFSLQLCRIRDFENHR